MAASIREAAEAAYTYVAENASRFTADVSNDTQFSILSTIMANRITLILGLVVLAAIAKMMSGPKLPKGVKPLPEHWGLPYAGRFWDVPEEGIANAWHFGQLHKKYGPIYVSAACGISEAN